MDRTIARTVRGMPTQDGAGVSLTRVIGQPVLRNLDPFLMLDHFHSDDPSAYLRGFPDHPHRGFETVTVMLDGKMRHRDSRGTEGLITGGGSQWMTAGRGIVHSEMPEQENGLMSGFQLWVNLPSREKMREPEYQDLQPSALTEVELGRGANARLIAGTLNGAQGPVRDRVTSPTLFTLRLDGDASVRFPITAGHRAFAFVFDGDATIAGSSQPLPKNQLVIFSDEGEHIEVKAGHDGAGLLVAAGAPIKEPIVQYGPFVMNTENEIRQAIIDYQNGTLAR